ncbi:hypothetical protein B0H14DRAFT_126407 [Mycena olivaceomarginata]|nr:hypothetical protein B0H14DRAFT_126407 [Mycena olivaceomarginata]
MQFDEGAEDIDSIPAPQYFVTEVEEREQDLENLEDADAHTVSRGVSVDPQHFTVEESFTDHEPDERGMSLDVVVTVDEEMAARDVDELVESVQGLDDVEEIMPESAEDLREEQVDSQIPVDEPVQQNGSKGSTILMPVSADPTVHDPFGSRQTTPPLSMVDATPVSIPLPASVLKAIRPDSGLFTPPSGAISAVDSAATTPHSVDDLFPADTEIPKGEHVDLGSAVKLVHAEENMAVFANGGGDAEEGMVDATSLQDEATVVPPELDVAALSSVEMEEDPVAIDRSQTNGTDFTADFTQPEHILTAYPSEVTLAASATPVLEFDPYPYSLSTPGERPDPVEQEEISPSSTGDKDSEEKTEGDEATSAATSHDHDHDEIELQYPSESDIKAAPSVDDIPNTNEMELQYPSESDVKAADIEMDNHVSHEEDGMEIQPSAESDVKGPADEPEVEDLKSFEVSEEAQSVEGIDEISDEESETDAAGDDDPDYEDSSSSVAADDTLQPAVDIDEEPADAPGTEETADDVPPQVVDKTDIEEPAADVLAMEESTPAVHDGTEETLKDDLPILEPVEVSAASVDVLEDRADEKDVPNQDKMENVVASDEVSSSLDIVPSSRAERSPQVASGSDLDEDADLSVKPSTETETSLKRKRGRFAKESTSNIGKIAQSRLSRAIKSNGKGKAKEEYFDNDDASSTSSASSAARVLNPGSSRSSSVASVRSAHSSAVVADSSPTLARVNSIIKTSRPSHAAPKLPPPPPPPPPPPLRLMHSHSHNRPGTLHRPLPLSRHTTQTQHLLQRTPSRVNVNESANESAAEIVDDEPPTPSTSSQPAPAPAPAPPRRGTPVGGSSPVTRSHCRFHKISLPENDEDRTGPRLFFVVPGCSLGDRELMEEEDIQDMGDATPEDGDRMIAELDSLNFSSYLIGILRQLVGMDILREQEVYYLPRPGEERPVKQQHGLGHERSMSKQMRVSSGGSFASDAGGPFSPGALRSPMSTSSRPPNSLAGSSSTASVKTATKRGRKKSDRGSPTPSVVQSQGDETEEEEDESPAAKRIRAAEAEGIAAAASNSPLRTRRSRRIDKEAAEYKPDTVEVAEESLDEEEGKGRRKKKKGRGVKRGRQSEAAVPAQEGGEERKTKKLKTHESVGSLAQ